MSRSSVSKLAVAVVLACAGLGGGASPAGPAVGRPFGRAPAVVSPEVLPDHRVTFRIQAPKAIGSHPARRLDGGDAAEKLTKDDEGVWSVTVGPLVPDFYSYSLHRRRREDPRPAKRHDQAGHRQPGQHVLRAGRASRLRGQQAGPARPDSPGLVSLQHAGHPAPHARLHAAGLRRQQRPIPGVLPASRRRR